MAAYTHDISMSVSYEMIHEKMTSDEWKDILKKYTKSQQEDLAENCRAIITFSGNGRKNQGRRYLCRCCLHY